MAQSAETVLETSSPAKLRNAVFATAMLVAASFSFGYVGWTQHVASLWLVALLCTAMSPIAGVVLLARLVRDRSGSRRFRLAGWFAAGAAIGIVLVPAAAILVTSTTA
jgi:hypothetical protein